MVFAGNVLVWLVVIIIPLFLMVILEFSLFFFYMLERAACEDRRSSPMPSAIIKLAESGESLSRAGRKGAAARSRSLEIEDRNSQILAAAQALLESGRQPHELAGILVRRYAGMSGYPKTNTQYRNITKPLRQKKNEN